MYLKFVILLFFFFLVLDYFVVYKIVVIIFVEFDFNMFIKFYIYILIYIKNF